MTISQIFNLYKYTTMSIVDNFNVGPKQTKYNIYDDLNIIHTRKVIMSVSSVHFITRFVKCEIVDDNKQYGA